MATLEKAIELAARAHAGQKDKQNFPYILHPLRVMMRVQDEEAQMVAVQESRRFVGPVPVKERPNDAMVPHVGNACD